MSGAYSRGHLPDSRTGMHFIVHEMSTGGTLPTALNMCDDASRSCSKHEQLRHSAVSRCMGLHFSSADTCGNTQSTGAYRQKFQALIHGTICNVHFTTEHPPSSCTPFSPGTACPMMSISSDGSGCRPNSIHTMASQHINISHMLFPRSHMQPTFFMYAFSPGAACPTMSTSSDGSGCRLNSSATGNT
jgi:hypothetical protein